MLKYINTINRDNRLFISILCILCILATSLYLIYESASASSSTSSPNTNKNTELLPPKKPSLCDKVDIQWLASDRVYWDGWTDKAMFFRPDGIFTKGNVYIKPGDEICIVVLLGPIPAKSITTASTVAASDHLGPQDSIVMFAVGNYSKKVITLEQHQNQPNAYVASVPFFIPDKYYLDVSSEYRSYFWETPVLHQFRPFRYLSSNELIVQPLKQSSPLHCPRANNSSSRRSSGTWVNHTELMRLNNKELFERIFMAYESTTVEDFRAADKIYLPDDPCSFNFKSLGYTLSQCLNQRIVHAWGDTHLKRNLKAIGFNGQQWCSSENDEEDGCVCQNKEDKEKALYPWIENATTPYILDNAWNVNTSIYYHSFEEQTIVEHASIILEQMKQTTTEASVVIIGVGNNDVKHLKISPKEFQVAFERFLTELRRTIYPHQTVIVRTPQYFCCGVIQGTAWNTARSLAFTEAVRTTVEFLNDNKIILWDVHSLGTDDTTCTGTAFSKRNVINLENQLLYQSLCSTA